MTGWMRRLTMIYAGHVTYTLVQESPFNPLAVPMVIWDKGQRTPPAHYATEEP